MESASLPPRSLSLATCISKEMQVMQVKGLGLKVASESEENVQDLISLANKYLNSQANVQARRKQGAKVHLQVSASEPSENPLHSYARFLCELSLGYEAHLGVKVDPHLEKRFCMAYHSGNANVLLKAFLQMQGELARRARSLDKLTKRT